MNPLICEGLVGAHCVVALNGATGAELNDNSEIDCDAFQSLALLRILGDLSSRILLAARKHDEASRTTSSFFFLW